jgi:hypothetical protein
VDDAQLVDGRGEEIFRESEEDDNSQSAISEVKT